MEKVSYKYQFTTTTWAQDKEWICDPYILCCYKKQPPPYKQTDSVELRSQSYFFILSDMKEMNSRGFWKSLLILCSCEDAVPTWAAEWLWGLTSTGGPLLLCLSLDSHQRSRGLLTQDQDGGGQQEGWGFRHRWTSGPQTWPSDYRFYLLVKENMIWAISPPWMSTASSTVWQDAHIPWRLIL